MAKKVFPPSWYAAQAARRKTNAKKTSLYLSSGRDLRRDLSVPKGSRVISKEKWTDKINAKGEKIGQNYKKSIVPTKVMARYKRIQESKGNVSESARGVVTKSGQKLVEFNKKYGSMKAGSSSAFRVKQVSPAVAVRYNKLMKKKGKNINWSK